MTTNIYEIKSMYVEASWGIRKEYNGRVDQSVIVYYILENVFLG